MISSDSQDLTHVGPGTVMGNFMRQYWIPAAKSSELVADGTPKAVAHDPQVRERYLGQDFDTHLAERGLPDARG